MDYPVPDKVKQSVNEQMIFAIIPFIDLYAAFRIEKLRIYFAINLAWAFMDWGLYEVIGDGGSIALFVLFIPIAVYLMRMWTIQWNNSLDKEVDNPISIDEEKIN